jgi:hypothetical protein
MKFNKDGSIPDDEVARARGLKIIIKTKCSQCGTEYSIIRHPGSLCMNAIGETDYCTGRVELRRPQS